MMSPNDLHQKHPSSSKESETQPAEANNRKPNSSSSSRPQDQDMKCPRCDSPNTKFCYYNNYSLTQPRHFCKTCRRYWTKGGALRNVPIGGGCRKNKKMMKSSSSSSARTDSSGSSDMGASCSATGFKFFQAGLSPVMDFNLGGLSFPRLNINPSPSTPLYNNNNNNHPFSNSFADISAGHTAMTNPPPCFSLDPSATATGSLLGFNYNPLPAGLGGASQDMGGGAGGGGGGGNGLSMNTNLASSIESLSCMNQDLHWKLQQQRLAMLFESENNNNNQKEDNHLINKPQPILFQNLEISKQGEVCSRKESGETATEWFFGNSYGGSGGGGGVNNNNNNNNANSTNSSSNGNDQSNNSTGYHHQQQAGVWGDLHQYNALP